MTAVGEHGRNVGDAVHLVFREDFIDLSGIAQVSLDGDEVGMAVGIGYEVEADDAESAVEQDALQDAAEKAGASAEKDRGHSFSKVTAWG